MEPKSCCPVHHARRPQPDLGVSSPKAHGGGSCHSSCPQHSPPPRLQLLTTLPGSEGPAGLSPRPHGSRGSFPGLCGVQNPSPLHRERSSVCLPVPGRTRRAESCCRVGDGGGDGAAPSLLVNCPTWSHCSCSEIDFIGFLWTVLGFWGLCNHHGGILHTPSPDKT